MIVESGYLFSFFTKSKIAKDVSTAATAADLTSLYSDSASPPMVSWPGPSPRMRTRAAVGLSRRGPNQELDRREVA